MKYKSKYEWYYLFLCVAWLVFSECEQWAPLGSTLRAGCVWINFAVILLAFCIALYERKKMQAFMREQAEQGKVTPTPKARDWNLLFVILLGIAALLMVIKLLYLYL